MLETPQKSSSMNDIIKRILTINNNSFKILQAMTDSLISTDEIIEVILTDEFGKQLKYQIPSLSFLKSKLYDLDDNLNLLRNKRTFIRNSDDIKNTIIIEPNTILNPVLSTTAQSRQNEIIKNLLDPSVFVNVDLKNQVGPFSRKVLIKEYVFDNPTKEDRQNLDLLFKDGDNTLQMTDDRVQLNIQSYNFKYSVNEYLYDYKPNKTIAFGSFIISGYADDLVETMEAGDYVSIRSYIFNDVFYGEYVEDDRNKFLSLKIGDKLATDTSSIFEVMDIIQHDNLNIVRLKLKFGTHHLLQGDRLKIMTNIIENKKVEIPVSYNQVKVVFFKDVDGEFNTIGNSFGNGTYIDSKELTILHNDKIIPFEDFYTSQVYDFSEFFEGLKKDMRIPAYMGIKPNAPVLLSQNFDVYRINRHIDTAAVTPEIDEILEHLYRTISLKDSTQQTIDKKKSDLDILKAIDTPSPEEEEQITNLENEIAEYEKMIKEKFQPSINEDIEKLQTLNFNFDETATKKAKYEIRGFWDFPQPKMDAKNRKQQVIKFIIQYRYLDILENPVCHTNIDFTSLDGDTMDAIFSDWMELETGALKKKWDSINEQYVWEGENIQESVPNINQLSIPINAYEKVQIRIKAISEAGYPDTILDSDWSNSVIVEFSEKFISLETNNLASTISKEVNNLIDSELEARLRKLEMEPRLVQQFVPITFDFLQENEYDFVLKGDKEPNRDIFYIINYKDMSLVPRTEYLLSVIGVNGVPTPTIRFTSGFKSGLIIGDPGFLLIYQIIPNPNL